MLWMQHYEQKISLTLTIYLLLDVLAECSELGCNVRNDFAYNNENYCHKSCMTVMRWKPHSFQTNCFWYVNAKKTYLLQTQDTDSSSLPFVSLLGP